MVFVVMGRNPENIKEKKKTGRRKTLKSEEKEKRRMREKSNNSTVHLLVLNYILLENIFLKKVVYGFIP